jgi:hypothetical protein
MPNAIGSPRPPTKPAQYDTLQSLSEDALHAQQNYQKMQVLISI